MMDIIFVLLILILRINLHFRVILSVEDAVEDIKLLLVLFGCKFWRDLVRK